MSNVDISFAIDDINGVKTQCRTVNAFCECLIGNNAFQIGIKILVISLNQDCTVLRTHMIHVSDTPPCFHFSFYAAKLDRHKASLNPN